MLPVQQTLTEMVKNQPTSPIQCDNSTAVGMTNATLLPRKYKILGLAPQLASMQGILKLIPLIFGQGL